MPEQPPLDEQTEIKKRAIRRVIAAGVLVAAGISALTVLTHYSSEPSKPQTAPSPTALPPEPAAPPPEETVAPPPTPEPEVQPPPPPPPEVVNVQPAAPSAPPPMAAKPAQTKPAAAQQPARSVSLKKAESLAETPKTQAPPAKPAAEKPVATAPPPATQPTTAQVPAKVAEPAAKGYAVQIGVFSDMANAKQLQERLTQNGIKSYTETKLHVGPFQNKAEAEQAIIKMRALGINGVVVSVH